MGDQEVRFTGGPLYWRQYRRGMTMRLADHVQELQIPGLVRPLKLVFRSPEEWEAEMAKDPPAFRIGVYRRVAPDRFRWEGWQ